MSGVFGADRTDANYDLVSDPDKCWTPEEWFRTKYPDPLCEDRLWDLEDWFDEYGIVGFETAEQMHAYNAHLIDPRHTVTRIQLAQERALGLQPTKPVWSSDG